MRYFVDKICPECGKKFCRLDFTQYAWRIDNKYYCSYSCVRKADEKLKQRRSNKYNVD